MAGSKPEQEAVEILRVIKKYFPSIIDAKYSIRWLHEYTTQGNQNEWAAVYFEEYCRPLLTNFLGGWYGARITRGSRIDYQRHYNWDLKVHAVKDKNGKPNMQIILNDKNAVDRIVRAESGIGFVIADVDFTFDISGSLQKWRDGIEGKSSEHTRSRIMKSRGTVTELRALYIKDTKTLSEGIRGGWISIFKQGRQPDGSPRNPKYQINLHRVPDGLFIRP